MVFGYIHDGRPPARMKQVRPHVQHAPINSPRLRPSITRRSFETLTLLTRYSADAMEIVKYIFLCIMRPSFAARLLAPPFSPPTNVRTATHAAIDQAETIELNEMSSGNP